MTPLEFRRKIDAIGTAVIATRDDRLDDRSNVPGRKAHRLEASAAKRYLKQSRYYRYRFLHRIQTPDPTMSRAESQKRQRCSIGMSAPYSRNRNASAWSSRTLLSPASC